MIRGLWAMIGAAALGCTTPAMSLQADDDTAEANITAPEETAVQRALDRGLGIYHHDQAAWHSTDTLREDLPRQRWQEVRGWLVDEVASGYRVTYYGVDGDSFRGIYSAIWSPGEGIIAQDVLAPDQGMFTVRSSTAVFWEKVQ